MEAAGTYGTIINKAVRRRTGQRLPPPTQSTTGAVSAKASSLPSKQAVAKDVGSVFTPLTELEAKPSQFSKDIQSKGSQEKRKASANPPQLKRDSSSIFKSFAKAKPPPKREGNDSSAGASGVDSARFSESKDAAMKDMSEGEEDDYMQPTLANSKVSGDVYRKTRKEREAALKKMMEDDDDDQEDEESNNIMENQQLETSGESPTSQPTEEAAQVSSGRGRGRRRVMKKKTIRDEEGYLGALKKLCYIRLDLHDFCILTHCFSVTKEELAWESFSEDEPMKNKPKPSSSLPTSSDKSKKGTNKAGQGSIMSFFGKK